jgi:hypothetical protein
MTAAGPDVPGEPGEPDDPGDDTTPLPFALGLCLVFDDPVVVVVECLPERASCVATVEVLDELASELTLTGLPLPAHAAITIANPTTPQTARILRFPERDITAAYAGSRRRAPGWGGPFSPMRASSVLRGVR